MKGEKTFKFASLKRDNMKHEDLDVWKKSIDIVLEIYKLTEQFPKFELYGLTNQIRRSAISVPSNIAEGCARFSDKETINFISIAIGSVAELKTQLIIAKKLQYIDNSNKITEELEVIKMMLLNLSKFLKSKDV